MHFSLSLFLGSIISHRIELKNVLALSIMFNHFQPFPAIQAFPHNFCRFQSFPAILSHSSHVQPFQIMYSYLQLFQPLPAIPGILTISSHFHPFPAIYKNYWPLPFFVVGNFIGLRNFQRFLSFQLCPTNSSLFLDDKFSHSSHFGIFPANNNYSQLQPLLAISCHYSYFQLFPAISRSVLTFQPLTATSPQCQPSTAISSIFSTFQPLLANLDMSSHLQPFPVIPASSSHFQLP